MPPPQLHGIIPESSGRWRAHRRELTHSILITLRSPTNYKAH